MGAEAGILAECFPALDLGFDAAIDLKTSVKRVIMAGLSHTLQAFFF